MKLYKSFLVLILLLFTIFCISTVKKKHPESAKEKAKATIENMTQEEIREHYKLYHKKKPSKIPRKKGTDHQSDNSPGEYNETDTNKSAQ